MKESIILHNINCLDYIRTDEYQAVKSNIIIVTDPPFNVGYHYNEYTDSMPEDEYYSMLSTLFDDVPFVCIHYMEELFKLAIKLNEPPRKVVSWVYNSNTAKQHRGVGFWRVKPDFTLVTQPYKNPTDKRIKERIDRGILGGRLYDWWNINQVKNVSKTDNPHPCVMPLEVMKNTIGLLPKDKTIFDPFMGSGTTGEACRVLGRDFIGCELNKEYFDYARKRILNEYTFGM